MKKVYYFQPTITINPGVGSSVDGNIIEPGRKFKINKVIWDYTLYRRAGGAFVEKIPHEQNRLVDIDFNLVQGVPNTRFTSSFQNIIALPGATFDARYSYVNPGAFEIDNLIIWNDLNVRINVLNFDLVNEYRARCIVSVLIEYTK